MSPGDAHDPLVAPGGFSLVDGVAFALFVLLFAWVAFAFMSALGGFWTCWRTRDGREQPRLPSLAKLLRVARYRRARCRAISRRSRRTGLTR